MKSSQFRVIIIADAPMALVRICGVTMIDRLLRTLQRAGFHEVTIFTTTPDSIEAELSRPAWARAKIMFELKSLKATGVTFGDLSAARKTADFSGTLVFVAAHYFDPRLIQALVACETSAAMVDSDPQPPVREWVQNTSRIQNGYFVGAFLFTNELLDSQAAGANLFEGAKQLIDEQRLSTLDVATLPSFVQSMRREIRPLWFPALEAHAETAGGLVLDTAQKGAMELVSYLETPIENWLIRRIWDTPVTPMQITIVGLIGGIVVTFAFATGHLWLGVALAFSVGVIDGIDGKQARVKVETTELGRWEPEMDYPIQISWWLALAYYFSCIGVGSHAFAWFAVFFISDLIDKLFTRSVKLTTGRYIENYSQFDRVVRLFSGQRSLYILMLFVGLVLHRPYAAFVAICCWHPTIAVVHGIRAWMISLRHRRYAERNMASDVASLRY